MRASGAAPSTVGLEQYAAQGGRVPAAFGGVMGQDGRRQYGLGSIFKKAAKAVKSVVKSPIGKAALLYGAYKIPGVSAFLKDKLLGPGTMKQGFLERSGGILNWIKKQNPWLLAGAAATLSPFAMKEEEEDLTAENFYRGEGIDFPELRKNVLARGLRREDYPFMPTDYYAAQGGRAGYAGGLSVDDDDDYISPREVALAALYNPQGTYVQKRRGVMAAAGGRIGAQEGGLMNMGGMEKDYRQEGGFVPIGGQEKADDVPARLSKNEFVFTADAVRAAGGGDIDAGAEVMENVMENLEAGGKVSEESQGLEGARNMFATSQRLQNRII